MKLVPYFYYLSLLALLKPSLASPVADEESAKSPKNVEHSSSSQETKAMVVSDSDTYARNILQDLLHIDINNATKAQTDMFDRILDEDKVCSKELRMLCLVDKLLRNVAKDLADDGITNVTEQVDTETFDTFMGRVMSVMSTKNIIGYSPYLINQPIKDLFLWREQGPEFRSSDIISPFIITDLTLKRKAIQDLIQSPSFQLKPLDKDGKFYEMKQKIEERQKDLDVNPDHPETIVIELDKVLSFNFADVTSKSNSTVAQNSTEPADKAKHKSNSTGAHESTKITDDHKSKSNGTAIQDSTEAADEINPKSNSTSVQDSAEPVDKAKHKSNSTGAHESTKLTDDHKSKSNGTDIQDSTELVDENNPKSNSTTDDIQSKWNSTDIQSSTEIVDQNNPKFNGTNADLADETSPKSNGTSVQDSTKITNDIKPGSNSTGVQDSTEVADDIKPGSNSTDIDNSAELYDEEKPGSNSTDTLDSAELVDEVLPELNSTEAQGAAQLLDEVNGNLFEYLNDKEELVLINSILRSLLGDILGVILDLPGKLVGTGSQGKNGRGKGKGGLSVTISLGGNDDDDEDNKRPSPRRRPPQ